MNLNLEQIKNLMQQAKDKAELIAPKPATLTTIREMQVLVEAPDAVATCVVFGRSTYPEILSVDGGFYEHLNPVVNHAELLMGSFGLLGDLPMYTDAYYHPEEQFLDRDSLYVASVASDGSVIKSVGFSLAPSSIA